MDKSLFVEDVKGMVPGPPVNALPVLAFVFDVEVRLRRWVVIDPVEGHEGDVGFAHWTAVWLVHVLVRGEGCARVLRF